ncbi:hypothetical protein Mgra_00003247 [Meloidogyne graminicola]|uniref:Uncharacterized protein n=1 Tax=Meloidogyne graminicola TaxID=189291 RepID=A0A8S9ZWF3_9BILA|nr:hypothetical protein Mgra_00003247 [Meloidogyne graminicola]
MRANLLNVTNLKPQNYEEHRWYLELKCSGCGEIYESWHYANVQETHTLTKGKGVCHISAKCSFCGRINTLEILTNSYLPYVKNEEFQTIVKFECRGLEPINFDPRIGWCCTGTESNSVFEEIDLNNKEWFDYDEKANLPVEIKEMDFKFLVVKR